MTSLKIIANSDMDKNLEIDWDSDEYSIEQWIDYLSSLPNVIDVVWTDNVKPAYTTITFDSEEAKTWFILRYS